MSSRHFFNINELSQGIFRQLAKGMETRVFPGENVMLSVVRIEPDCAGQVHSHPEEQWGLLLEGSGIRIQDGVEHPVSVGDLWQSPGGIPHGFIAGSDGAVILDVFSPPREEYKNAGSGFAAAADV